MKGMILIMNRNPTGNMNFSVVSDVCCKVEVSATSWSLFRRSSTECHASLCAI